MAGSLNALGFRKTMAVLAAARRQIRRPTQFKLNAFHSPPLSSTYGACKASTRNSELRDQKPPRRSADTLAACMLNIKTKIRLPLKSTRQTCYLISWPATGA